MLELNDYIVTLGIALSIRIQDGFHQPQYDDSVDFVLGYTANVIHQALELGEEAPLWDSPEEVTEDEEPIPDLYAALDDDEPLEYP